MLEEWFHQALLLLEGWINQEVVFYNCQLMGVSNIRGWPGEVVKMAREREHYLKGINTEAYLLIMRWLGRDVRSLPHRRRSANAVVAGLSLVVVVLLILLDKKLWIDHHGKKWWVLIVGNAIDLLKADTQFIRGNVGSTMMMWGKRSHGSNWR